ncbi:MAG: CARDB domain-containing protein, partial [Bacteroidota bacterium]
WFTSEYGGNGTSNSLTRILAFQLEKKDNDLAVGEISQPETSSTLGGTESVVASVRNIGNLDAASYDILLYLDDQLIETFNQTTALTAGDTYEHTFSTTVDLSTLGEYVIRVEVDYTGDESSGNNSQSKTVKKLAGTDAALSLVVIEETCTDQAIGELTITNEGDNDVTSAEIELFRGTQSLEILNWTGSLATGESTTLDATFSGLVAGANQVSAVINSVNGAADEVSNNNTAEGNVVVSDGFELVTLELTTDNFPNETLWSVEDVEGNVILSGGPYSTTGVIIEQLCLPIDACYVFTMVDTFGDGICCGEGQGSYTLFNADGEVIFEGDGQFGSSEETGICVGNTPSFDAAVELDLPNVSVCSNDFITQFIVSNVGAETLTTLDVDVFVNDDLVETLNWEGELAFREFEFVQVTFSGLTDGANAVSIAAKNPNGMNDEDTADNEDSGSITVEGASGQENISLVINLDNFPEETTWELTDDTDAVLYQGGPYADDDLRVIESLCVPADGCYSVTIFDAESDGICCGFGNGSYSILDGQGNVITESSGSFGSSETTDFCLGNSCNLSIEVSQTNLIGDELGAIMITASGSSGYLYSIDAGDTFKSSNVFNDLAEGDYEIVVKDEFGCFVDESITLEAIVLGTDLKNDEFIVSPNPSNGIFSVSVSGFESIDGFLVLQVFDINGKFIQERKLSRWDGTFRGEISLYAYPNGIYLLKPKNEGSNEMIKLIKQ